MNWRIKTILEHMLDDAQDVVAFSDEAGSIESFRQNTMIYKAVVMSLLNIGELAAHLPDEFIAAHEEIPWKHMTGMRNIAAHGYQNMNLDIVWDTAKTSIPELLNFLHDQLKPTS